PPAIKERVQQQAIALLDKSPKPINTMYEAALYLTQALKQNYTIKTDIPFLEKKEDLVEAFLFRDQGGYPDHFSTVLTMMLRSLGIPARFTVGFAPGQFNPFTGYYLVHNTDAYG
ncbi:MAG: transglutaminase-like domain-containing protein, partial [Microcystaceae cyanobacterium]